jgi:hypothetical protein
MLFLVISEGHVLFVGTWAQVALYAGTLVNEGQGYKPVVRRATAAEADAYFTALAIQEGLITVT